jgi:probable F420-dependent oxidoreductase
MEALYQLSYSPVGEVTVAPVRRPAETRTRSRSCQDAAVRFTLALPMVPADRLVPLARRAEAAGWHGVSMPESVFYPEEVTADYPYTSDGTRFWPADAPWVDPWVAIPAMAAATERLVFGTNVNKLSLRHPLLMAKTVGSTAAMFPGRVELGVGLSWIPEEFAWLGQEMRTRGKRLDEQIEVIRAVLDGGWVEHHGPHYDFGRLRVDPAPSQAVPIQVGGHSDAGLRRAARLGDGWIGAQCDLDQITEVTTRLRQVRDEVGEGAPAFSVKLTPIVAPTAEAMAEVRERGVTEVITVPWYFFGGDPEDPSVQDESIDRFAAEVIEQMEET